MEKLKLFLGFIKMFISKVLSAIESLVFSYDKRETASLYLNVANDYTDKKQYNEAVDMYKKAVLLKNDSSDPHYKLGRIYMKSNEMDEAIMAFETGLEFDSSILKHPGKENPQSKKVAEACFYLGFALTKTGKSDKAINYYQKAVELDPKNAEYNFRLGLSYDSHKKTEQAIDYYEKAIISDPTVSKYYYSIGLAYDSQGKHEKAVEFFKKSLELDEAGNDI